MKGLSSPTCCVIGRVLNLACHQQVALAWRGQAWYPVLLRMLWDFSRLIAPALDLIQRPNRCSKGDRPSTSHVACLRERFSSFLLAAKLLQQSWRSKSAQSYNLQFRKWAVWCAERSRNLILGPTSDVANFLVELYEEGYQASSLIPSHFCPVHLHGQAR